MPQRNGFLAWMALLSTATTVAGQTPLPSAAPSSPSPALVQLDSTATPTNFFDHLVGPMTAHDERPQSLALELPDSLEQLHRQQPAASDSHLEEWVRWLVLKNLPPNYEDNRKWGLEKEVYDGFRFRREGLKIETERKYRRVKQGTWSRYYLEFVEPEQRLQLRIPRFEQQPDQRLVIEAVVEVPLHAFGRISQWQRDVQLISLSTNADVTVRLWIQATVGFQLNPLVFPPEISFVPKVDDARLEMIHFEVHRISQLRGPLAENLGKGMRDLVDEKLEEFSDQLVAKMNRQLEKQRDKLKLSWSDQLPEWVRSLPKTDLSR